MVRVGFFPRCFFPWENGSYIYKTPIFPWELLVKISGGFDGMPSWTALPVRPDSETP